MAISIWVLYIGVFLCASGIGLVIGIIFIAYWGIKTLEEAKQGNTYTEDNYAANIDHYHADSDGSGGNDYRKPPRRINGTLGEDLPRYYASKDTLEENR